MPKVNINIFVPGNPKQLISVETGTTVAQLKSIYGIDANLKADADGQSLNGNSVVTGYKRIAFSAAAKGASRQAEQLVATMSKNLMVAEISNDPINFGTSDELQELRKGAGAGFLAIVPVNVAVKEGDMAMVANPHHMGLVVSIRKITVDEIAMIDLDSPMVVGVVDMGDYDENATEWENTVADRVGKANEVIENARRQDAIKHLGGEFVTGLDALALDASAPVDVMTGDEEG